MEIDCNKPLKKPKLFCARTFSKELKGSEALKSLKNFIFQLQNDEDILINFMENGGSVYDILSILDSTANQDLTTALPVFEAVQLIFLRFQSFNSEHHQHCLECAEHILNNYLQTLQSLLSINISKYKKVALKLLTSIVTLRSSFAFQVLNLFSFSTSMINDLISPAPEKESVRKYFILFVLSFLIEGNSTLIKAVMENKGFLEVIIPGLKYDEATTVNMALTLMENKILKNMKITKTLKLRTFNTQVVRSLFDLFNWKGPLALKKFFPLQKKKHKVFEVDQKDKELVINSLCSFLIVLCTSKKFGILFSDKSLKFLLSVNNQLLLSVFKGLANPLNNNKMSDIILRTLISCPDLMESTLLMLEPFLQPRNSSNWIEAMQFAENLLKELDIISWIKDEKKIQKENALKIVKTFCTPAPLLRIVKLGAEINQPFQVRLRALNLLVIMCDSSKNIIEFFLKFGFHLKTLTMDYISKFLPDFKELMDMWHDVCKNDFLSSCSEEIRSFYFMTILNSFIICMECSNVKERSTFNLASYLLDSLEKTKEVLGEKEYITIQTHILKFIEMDVHLLTPKMDLFKIALKISLQLDKLSLASACIILSNLEIFKNKESEIDIWLLSFVNLSAEDRILVSECLIESIIFSTTQTNNNNYIKEVISPLIFNCVIQLQNFISNTDEELKKKLTFKRYLEDIIIHLQHFYPETTLLYENLKSEKKAVGKYVIQYLKCWKTDSLASSNILRTNLSFMEQEIEIWLLNEKDIRNIKEILTCELEIHMLFRIFTVLIGHLVIKILKNNLRQNISEKFLESLSYILNINQCEISDESLSLIASNLNNFGTFYKKSFELVFRNKILLNTFNSFTTKKCEAFYLSKIIVETLMKKKQLLKVKSIENLLQNWKVKFLCKLKKRLRKKKSIQSIVYFEEFLNFFDYHEDEIADIIKLMIDVFDLNIYIENGEPSKWIYTLLKFINLQCQKEINENIIHKLFLIVKHFYCTKCTKINELYDCFNIILKNHPKCLVLIENGFLDIILESENFTYSTITLGKLLLNDPDKVKHFLSLKLDKKKFELVIPLLSTLIFASDIFYEAIISEKTCLNWKIHEISNESTPLIFQFLEKTFFHFEKKIIYSLKGNNESFTLENLPLFQCLIKLFIGKNTLSAIEKDIEKGNFQPVLLFEAIKKFKEDDSLVKIYLQGLLVKLLKMLKHSDNINEKDWIELSSLLSSNQLNQLVGELNFKNIVNSSEWNEFVKCALRVCFKKREHPFIFKILRSLIIILYRPINDFKHEITLNFQMIISHSQFLNVLLNKSLLKNEVLELFYSLVKRIPNEMSSKHIPILLASYNATMNSTDVTILKILQIYEQNKINLAEYEPFVWGEAAISHYSIGSTTGLSLWQKFNMMNILNLLDSQKLDVSLKKFPIFRKLQLQDENHDAIDYDSEIYDPSFILPLFSNLLSPGSVVFLLPFIYKGGLAYTIRALSSECNNVRSIASFVLMRFYNHIELSQNFKQKPVWLHYVNCIRFGVENIFEEPVPNIITIFFAKMSFEISGNLSEINLPLQNFLMAKTYFSFKTIPEFLPLFHSSHINFRSHRIWLLNVLKNAIITHADIQIFFYSMALKIIFCFFHSPFCDIETKKLIIQVIEKLIIVDKSQLLFSEYGLLSWINSIDFTSCTVILTDLLKLINECNIVVTKIIKSGKNQQTIFSYTIQILNISMKLLPIVNAIKSLDTFVLYLQIILKCLLSLLYLKKNEWLKINNNELLRIIDSGVVHLGVDVGKFINISFFIKDNDDEYKDKAFHYLKKVVFLFQMLLKFDKNL